MGGGQYTPDRSDRGGQTHDPSSTMLETEPKPKIKREYRVLVTGMGPFPDGRGGRYGEDDNTSHLITNYLPASLPVGHASNPTSLPITILNPTSGPGKSAKAEYAYVRHYIQALYDAYSRNDKDTDTITNTNTDANPPLDAILHLGMADGWEWYSIEERAFGEDLTCNWWFPAERTEGYYMIPDDAGKTVRDMTDAEGRGMWKGKVPVGIACGVHVERLVGFVRRVVNSEDTDAEGEIENENEKMEESENEINLKEEKAKPTTTMTANTELKSKPATPTKEKVAITPHFEAGSYLCGFIYYESLATCLHRGLKTKVVFSHVPGWRDEARLRRGADVVCGIVGGLCDQIHRQVS